MRSGKRLDEEELGVGPPTADRLAMVIASAITDKDLRTQAAGLDECICADDGVG